MKQLGKDILVSAAVGILLPAMILNYGAKVRRMTLQEAQIRETTAHTPLPVKVRNEQGIVTEGEMDDYLVGVVLAEMPASFEPEALKAQAIVARTYARKAYTNGGKHGDGSVCTDPACCQGYLSKEAYLEQGGTEADVERISSAVSETSGQVLTYGEELIEATYFSCSGGSTEDAVAVWGTEFPYLQAVDSPGEENAAHYQDTVDFLREELEEKLGVTLGPAVVEAVTYTEGGGVDSISFGGRYFTGTEVRRLLGLRSTAFSVSAAGNTVTFTTRGYGHRVGMSQYGADAMAVEGKTCQDILSHYYRGTTLVQLP